MRFTLLAVSLAAIATPALAQETRMSAATKFTREFAATDTNKDGNLTRAEVGARIGRMSTTKQKMDPVHVKRLTDLWFDTADADKSGKVSQVEAQALLSATFRRYDANGDGKIGGDERAAAAAGVKRGR